MVNNLAKLIRKMNGDGERRRKKNSIENAPFAYVYDLLDIPKKKFMCKC